MSKQCLSIDQMRHLHELGLDTSKASIHYWIIKNGEYSEEKGGYVFSEEPSCVTLNLYPYEFKDDVAIRKVEDIPTLTLQNILDILPPYIDDFWLNIEKDCYKNGEITYFVNYKDPLSKDVLINLHSVNTIDAAYEILCWLIENDYLKKE